MDGWHHPLGYDNIDKKLVINAREAETVKRLFQLYLQHGTVSKVKHQADNLGLITKSDLTAIQK